MENYDSRDHKRTRNAYRFQCTFEYFVALIMTDSYLANLLSYLGMEQSTIGIVTSLISLAFLFQMLSLFIVPKIRNTKLVATAIHCTGQTFFMLLYFVPFLPMGNEIRRIITIPCILFAYLGNYLVTTVIFKWGMSFAQPNMRARFSATKEMISLLTGTVYSVFMGYMMDKFIASGNIKGGFLFSGIAILVINICDFTCLLLMKNEPIKEKTAKAEPFFKTVGKIFSNKAYVRVIGLAILWNITCYSSLGFVGIYKMDVLGYTVGQAQLITIAGGLARFAFSRPFGKYTDSHSYASGIRAGITVTALSFVFFILSSRSARWLIVIFTVIYNLSLAGISENLLNITCDYVPDEYFVQATAMKNSIGGVCGFLTALGAGKILDLVEANGNKLFGITVYGQQVLAAISFLAACTAIIYCRLVVEKLPRNERNMQKN